ncbi:MAG: hypothetical protein JRI68_03850 [Deltaproteobacteria bacterium]|nr:hypothetical protein [Deltaproteobacteria bacterium]
MGEAADLALLQQLCAGLSTIAARADDTHWAATWSEQRATLTDSFDRLEALIRRVDPQAATSLLTDPQTLAAAPALRRLRSRYETETERQAAREILATPAPGSAMRRVLAAHYGATTIHSPTFAEQIRNRHSCLIIGSGPLPVTAALLLDQTALALTCLDRDRASCELGAKIIEALDVRPVATRQADALHLTDLACWDVIMVTALADDGDAPGDGHQRLIAHLADHCLPGTLLCLRTPYALGELLYPVVDTAPLHRCSIDLIPSPRQGRSSMVLAQLDPSVASSGAEA